MPTVQQPNDEIVKQLGAEVDGKLDATEPQGWGEEIDLAEGEKFYGRFIETAISPVTNREVVRACARTDEGWGGPPVFIRGRTVLLSELDRVRPQHGDYIVIARGDNREGANGPYHMYAVAVAPCPDPMPDSASDPDSDIPF
jgi:hypothetical protein